LLHAELERHRVFLRVDLPQDLPRVMADGVQLQQVLLNLIMNAVEAMSSVDNRQRLLLVKSTHHGASDVLIMVQDSGPGIDPNDMDRIFDAFFTTKPHGVGSFHMSVDHRLARRPALGLQTNSPRNSLLRSIANRRIGQPMKTQESAEQPIVFVIDDDAPLRDALKRLFRMVGLRAETFASGPDFLKQKLPDVASCLVLDIRLPGISGLDFQAELAKADIGIPIVFMTGHGDIPMTVKAMKAGAVEFLAKPFRDQDMLDAVQLALQRDRTRRQAERANAQLRTSFESLSP